MRGKATRSHKLLSVVFVSMAYTFHAYSHLEHSGLVWENTGMKSLEGCSKLVQARVSAGIHKGVMGLVSASTHNGIYIIVGDVCVRPVIYGPFRPEDIEIMKSLD